jgi:hypothetical protein
VHWQRIWVLHLDRSLVDHQSLPVSFVPTTAGGGSDVAALICVVLVLYLELHLVFRSAFL